MSRKEKKQIQVNQSITIYDIAKEVGLCASTVGRALNGTGRVSKDTRKRVVDIAAKMGYQPSLVAKSLSINRTYTIGVVVPMLGDTAYSSMVYGIESVTRNAGYNIILCCSGDDSRIQMRDIDMLQSRRVEGIIIIPVVTDGRETAQLMRVNDSGMPVVVLEQNIPDETFTKVLGDNYGGSMKLVNHLIHLGHRRIGFVYLGDTIMTNFAGMERYAGYKAAMLQAGLDYSEDQIASITDSTGLDDDGHHPVQFEAYYEAAGRPSAVFATCDMLAIKTMQACAWMGLKVPEDIAVVGFDDIVASAYINPPLTTVHQPAVEMGKRAADLVLAHIKGELNCQVQERIQGKLIVRQSCGVGLPDRALREV